MKKTKVEGGLPYILASLMFNLSSYVHFVQFCLYFCVQISTAPCVKK